MIDPQMGIGRLAEREEFRERYWNERDPIADERLGWRAHSLRNTVHLLPGTSILEVGCGSGRFTRRILRYTRGENPITALSFLPDAQRLENLDSSVEFVTAKELPGPLVGRQFDVIVGADLLDRGCCAWFLRHLHELLTPGGQFLLYETNPWNPYLRIKRSLGSWFGDDPRKLLSQPRLYELISEIGFIRVFAVYNDFVFAPLTPRMVWWFRNLSILLENAPLIRRFAGSILVQAQKPPRAIPPKEVSLCRHDLFFGKLSVVIPCRNEEANVRPLVEGLRRHYDDYIKEILLLDDGSTDSTPDEIRSLSEMDPRVIGIRRVPPHGVGHALAEGLRAAQGDWVLTLDCDFQHLLPDLRDLFEAASTGADIVTGSRFSRRSVLLNYPFAKIVSNRTFHTLAVLGLHKKFRDLTNNLKLMKKEVAKEIVIQEPHFAANAETGFLPLLAGRRVVEVPISWIDRAPDMGVTSFHLGRVGGGYARVLYHLFLLRWFGKGRYRDLPVHGDIYRTERYETMAR